MPESTVYCSYAPGAGKTTYMLKRAVRDKGDGRVVSFDFVYDSGRPSLNLIENDESRCLRKEAFFDPKAIIAAHPQITVLDELMMTNRFTHKPLYRSFREIADNQIAVYTTTNLIHVRSLNQKYRKTARIFSEATVADRTFLTLGKLIFIDIEPELLWSRYARDELFPKHRKEFLLTYSIERLSQCRALCLDFLGQLHSEQYEIVQV